MFLEPREPVTPAAARKSEAWTAWDGLMCMMLAALGISLLGQLWLAFHPTTATSSGSGMGTAVVLVAVMGLVPVAWLASTRRSPVQGSLDYLGIKWHPRNIITGTLTGAALWIVALLVGQLPLQVGHSAPAWLVLPAATSEEILFRGILLRRLGISGQAGLFALFHAASGATALLFAALAGFLLGFVASRWGLTSSTTAHALYNALAT